MSCHHRGSEIYTPGQCKSVNGGVNYISLGARQSIDGWDNGIVSLVRSLANEETGYPFSQYLSFRYVAGALDGSEHVSYLRGQWAVHVGRTGQANLYKRHHHYLLPLHGRDPHLRDHIAHHKQQYPPTFDDSLGVLVLNCPVSCGCKTALCREGSLRV